MVNRSIWLLLFVAFTGISIIQSKLYFELTKFSKIAETQYFISSSGEIRMKNNDDTTSSLEVVDPYCLIGTLDGKVCNEYLPMNKDKSCPSDSIPMKNKCVRFHNTRCPRRYTNVDGKCILDRGCDPKQYDQVGRNCYEKCQWSHRRYYSNLCISEKPGCPLQFRWNGTDHCILSECPTQLDRSDDDVYCQTRCPPNFEKINSTTCESDRPICPKHYEKEGIYCVQKSCERGLLLNGFCLDTICPSNYEFDGKVCKKCLTSTHSVCSGMDWRCPMGLIEIGSGPYMQCVMICPRKYAQFGKYCYDISVTGCPEGFLHFEDGSCIKESDCPKDYEIFGKECVRKHTYVGFIINTKETELCPTNYVEYQGRCFKLTEHSCPEGMVAIEDSQYCVSNCPKEFNAVQRTCIASSECKINEFTFMGKCYEKCPFGTVESNNTKSCKVVATCENGQLLDFISFRCIDRTVCLKNSLVSPDGKFCHRKDQCNGQGYILDQYCISSCPVDFDVDSQFCKRKPAECPSLKLANGTCVNECPEGQVPKNRICVAVKVDKNPIVCGVNKELLNCTSNGNGCIGNCVCKVGFVEVEGEDYCVPKENKCQSKHILDLIFIIDGSQFMEENMFNEVKFFLMETMTQIYSSGINVRVGIIVYGPENPKVVTLDKTEKLCDCMKIVTKILYISTGGKTTLVDAFGISRKVVLSQCNGARIGSSRQIFVIGKLSEMTTSDKDDLLVEIDLQKELGHRLTFITINNNVDIPHSIYQLNVRSTKELSQYMSKVYDITCKDITCAKGYQKIGDDCIDINECDSLACNNNSKCINTPGSFVCYCSGTNRYLNFEYGCVPEIDECYIQRKVVDVCDAVTCRSPANCTTSNGAEFCICPRGFTYDNTEGCIDVDECKISPCLGIATCRNSYGSFDCFCPKGFEYNVHFGCVDIDECRDSKICSGNGICQNMIGSYRCACNSGYEYIQDKGCIDIDECQQTSKLCQGDNVICQNTPGSFKCICPAGLEYKDKGCVDIDECLKNNTCPEGSTCVNFFGGFNCTCNKGFVYNNDTKLCELDKTLNVVQPKADLIFGVDTSESMKDYMDIVKDMLKNIITDYKLKSLAIIKSYFALTTGGNSEVKIIYIKETDNNVLNHTESITYMGGKSLLSTGLRSAKNLYLEHGQVNSSKLVIFITATKPSTYDVMEISEIKKQVNEIKKDGRLLIIYVGDDVKSSEWNIVFKIEEIEEHVIAVSQDFMTTIHKVIYQKTDRLIKCPEGFIFLDKVCQYKTTKAMYCKWDDKLYALNSTWTSSCAVYGCKESGVVVLETNCMGFDGDCYKEDEFFPCNLYGKLNWRCKCKIVNYIDEETSKSQQRIDYIIINFDKNATIESTKLEDENGKCVLPFKFENKWYYACTDSKSYNRWCSNFMYYKRGYYSYCARQVTSQCIFDGKIYKEGDKWNVGCNVIVCDSGKPYVTARCTTINGTCVPLNADNYPCQVGEEQYTSCMCLQDNFGYGENTAVKGKITGEKTKVIGGGLVEFCEELSTGQRYESGKTWESNCFTLQCSSDGITKVIDKKCSSADGKCIQAGSSELFTCQMGGRLTNNCQCVMDNDELVLIANEGGKIEKKIVDTKKIIRI